MKTLISCLDCCNFLGPLSSEIPEVPATSSGFSSLHSAQLLWSRLRIFLCALLWITLALFPCPQVLLWWDHSYCLLPTWVIRKCALLLWFLPVPLHSLQAFTHKLLDLGCSVSPQADPLMPLFVTNSACMATNFVEWTSRKSFQLSFGRDCECLTKKFVGWASGGTSSSFWHRLHLLN